METAVEEGLATTCVTKATGLQSRGQQDPWQMLCATCLSELDSQGAFFILNLPLSNAKCLG